MKKIKLLLAVLLGTLTFGTTVYAAEYTVKDANAVFYSNENAVLYSDADTNSKVILTAEAFPDGIEVQVTGVTSNGFFRTSLNGVSYIPVTGLQAEQGTGTVVNPQAVSMNPADQYKGYKPTLGDKNALKKAKRYLKFSAFSYERLVDQLEYEGYTESEARYGAAMSGANWTEQAVKKAKSYLKSSSFSYLRLIDQLEYEKFSAADAKYAADVCGADWNEQAAKKAKSYMRSSSFSRERLISQLEYEKFTHEQAIYGVTAVGY